MSSLEVNLGYTPRSFQDHLHRNMKRFNVFVLHRRAGKTVFAVHELIDQALRCQNKNPQYAYIAPTYTAAKRISWDMFKQVALLIPGATANEAELRIEIPRPATRDKIKIILLGAENPAAVRGIYLDGVILDEAAFMDQAIWTSVIRPAISDREGWAIFISTPQGENWFYDLYKQALEDPLWFTYLARASDTQIVPISELEAAKAMMSEAEYAQEFECSFSAANVGAYWGKEIEKLENTGRITGVPYDKILGVKTFWDLGVDDATAIWFVQIYGRGEIRVIDYVEESGLGLDDYVKILKSRNYRYDGHHLPHDAQVRELGTGKSRLEILQQSMRGERIRVLPKYDVADSINAARLILSKCWFDAEKCKKGIHSLKSYQRRWNPKLKVFEQKPLHDFASHGADAFRYLAMGLDENRDDDTVRSKYQRYSILDVDPIA